jgi:hypothetical protein
VSALPPARLPRLDGAPRPGQNPAVDTPAQAPQAPQGRHRRLLVGLVVAAVVAVVAALVVAGRPGGRGEGAAGAATSAAAGVVTPGTSGGPAQAAPSVVAPTGSTTGPTGPGATSGPGTVAAVRATVPELVGKNAAAARIELEGLGFGDVRFASQDAGEPDVVLPQNWTVTRQSPAAGTRVQTDTAIVLTCTRRV